MAKRKRNTGERGPFQFSYHTISRRPDGILNIPADLPADALPLPFQGEMMECLLCGRRERSDPEVESQWRALSTGNARRHYFCPAEFPPDGSASKLFEMAYELALAAMLAEESGQADVLADARKLRPLTPWYQAGEDNHG